MAIAITHAPELSPDLFGARPINTRSLWSDAGRSLARNRVARFGLFIVLLVTFVAAFGPLITPHNPDKQDLDNAKASPSREHLFGTDQLGRDYFSRILAGARTALIVGATVTVLSCVIGVLLGAAAAFFGGVTDVLVNRALDMALAFPKLLLA